jgi:hypothetical protein
MGMFRNCELGWNHGQFGNFCRIISEISKDEAIAEFCAQEEGNLVDPKDCGRFAKALTKVVKHPELADQASTVQALIDHLLYHASVNGKMLFR